MSEADRTDAPIASVTSIGKPDEPGLRLLRLQAGEDGQSIHRVARKLDMGLSELQRLLSALGNDPLGRFAQQLGCTSELVLGLSPVR